MARLTGQPGAAFRPAWSVFKTAYNSSLRRTFFLKWLRVFRKLELSAKPHEHWVWFKPTVSGKVRLLWQSK